jgi:hypothetical protein
MKNLSVFCFFLFFISSLYAQVGIGTVSPNSTLQVNGSFSAGTRSFTSGTTASGSDFTLLFTGASAASLTLPDATTCVGRTYIIKNVSLTVPTPVLTINTTSSQTIDGSSTLLLNLALESLILVSDGSNWQVSSETSSVAASLNWLLGGNSVASIQNLGTTTNYDLPFITNNTEGMRLSATGNFGIGTSTFNATNPEKLIVNAGTTSSVNAIVGKGNLNNYLQLNIQNTNAGTNASSDVVATADNGNETTNYVDLGINSSANTSGSMGNANDAYLYNMSQNFLIGTGVAAKSLVFMTGGTTQSTNERMRINGSGFVGIGTNNPTYLLHVVASSNPLYLAGVQTGLSTDSLVTILNGVVRKISPAALVTSSSNAWALVGNNNTQASNYFLGTTNTDPLILKINSQLAGRIDTVNSFLGYQSGYDNGTTASQSTGIGYHALFANTSGTYNTAIGYNSLPNNTTGSNNVGLGYGADVGSTNSNSIVIGASSYTNYSDAIALGTSAQVFDTYGIAVGDNSYAGGTDAIAIGSGPGTPKTQSMGTSSIAMGYNAYSGGTSSIAIGTGTNTSSTNSVVIGNNANTSQNNSIILGDATNNSLDVGIGTSSPGAKLHIHATAGNNPLLLQGLAVGSTTDNLLTINTTTGVVNSLPYSSFSTGWMMGGNSVASIQNLGTTSNYDLPFITNNTEGMRLSATGNFGIGTSTFNATNPEKLIVSAGTTSSVNAIVGKGSLNNYLQLNIQNTDAGTNASSDVVATADNGSETTNYVDLGINSSANTSGSMGNANDAYLYNMSQNFLIGTGVAAKSLIFLTGGTTQSTNERMRINGSGNVGIANINPLATLDVDGTVKVGTAGSILNSIIRFTNQSITDNTTFTYNQTRTETFTLTGVNQYASVIVTPRSALPSGLGIAYAYASATNTVLVSIFNETTNTLALGTIIFDITVIQ